MYIYSENFVSVVPGLAQLPPAINTLVYPGPQFGPDSRELQNYIKADAQQDALRACAVLKQEYLDGEFRIWLLDYSDGKIDGGNPDAPPPTPPLGAMAQMNPDNLGWGLVQTGPPVCDIPTYTKLPKPETQAQAGNVIATFAADPFSKATRIGLQITAPDGSVFLRVK